MAYTIYIVEDDQKIAESMATYLELHGYNVVRTKDFSQVLSEFLQLHPHLVILDIQLPYQNGYYLCRQMRKSSHVPILFVSSRSGEVEQIFGIESGADDYITKPFSLDLLLVKIKALLRRVYGDYRMDGLSRNILSIGQLQLDLERMELSYRGESQSLSKNEGKLLHLLMKNKGKVVLREECLEVLWDDKRFVEDNTLTVNVTRVRKKLAAWDLDACIVTKRGLGYQFNPMPLKEGSRKRKN